MAYIALRGSLHLGRRVECGSALVALQINGAHGGKARYSDFTPHESSHSGDMTPETILAILSRGAING